MFKFGKRSEDHIKNTKIRMKEIVRKALSYQLMDFGIIESIRPKLSQNILYDAGKSKVKWPHSKHNIQNPHELCDALDIVPFINGQISWKIEHCLPLSGIILAAAAELGYKIRWGGNWDMDGEPVTDQSFQDLVHYELVD